VKIYVAGRFQSYEKVRACIDMLRDQGYEITYDWTRTPEFGEDGHPKHGANGQEQPRGLLQHYAQNDIQGVRSADALVLLADDSLAGAWVEMGIALERSIPIYVVKPERWTIFLECFQVTVFGTQEELFAALVAA
jgi:nucleoside 2-deoxyribosyltransferase